MCDVTDYCWSASPQQEAELRANGYVYAGETGRYPSRLMKRCGCTRAEAEILSDLGRACETHGCRRDEAE